MRPLVFGLIGLLLSLTVPQRSSKAAEPADAFEANKALGRGINLGNALEAPREGVWGMVLQPEYFTLIKQAGFQTVRVPTKWSAHAADEAPYTIDPAFFQRVDWVLDQAERNGLNVVLNIHHYDEMDRDPQTSKPRFLALWKQIAQRYRDRPASVCFELLNEPHGQLSDDLWNSIVPEALRVIRQSNPTRIVIVGPGMWNNVNNLPKLQLPVSDRFLIATFHYYLPFPFTHQGANWVANSQRWLGTTWTATPEELAALRADFDKAAGWAKANNRPLFLGEFGAYSRADMDSRVKWTSTVAREAEQRGFSWAYWEFGAGFGIYDRDAKTWRGSLRDALIPPIPSGE
jgi:endoglucanase